MDITQADKDFRQIGDVDYATVIEPWLRGLKSPMLPTARATYTAAQLMTALFWAQALYENRAETTGILVHPGDHNPVTLRPWLDANGKPCDPRTKDGLPPGATGIIDAPDGSHYLRFGSDAACAAEWKHRLTDPAYKGGIYTQAKTLQQMIDIYCPPGDKHAVTGDDANAAYVPAVLATLREFAVADHAQGGTQPAEDPEMSDSPFVTALKAKKVLFSAGHNNTTRGGAYREIDWTPKACHALVKAFKAKGWTADYLQTLDGDGDPDFLNQDLDGVGITAVRLDKSRGPYCLFWSQHYDGGPVPGLHVIPPAADGLIFYGNGRADSGDNWADNPADIALGRQLVKMITAKTKLKARTSGGVVETGIMPEYNCGVGLDGWRLAEMHDTLPMQPHCARVIVECGSIGSSDADFIWDDDFIASYAAACADAAEAWRGAQIKLWGAGAPAPEPQPQPQPQPKPTTYAPKLHRAWLDPLIIRPGGVAPDQPALAAPDGTGWFAMNDLCVLEQDVTPRQTCAPKSPAVDAVWKKGRQFQIGAGGTSNTDKKQWGITPDGACVPLDAVKVIADRPDAL